jgi:hypothetical protein
MLKTILEKIIMSQVSSFSLIGIFLLLFPLLIKLGDYGFAQFCVNKLQPIFTEIKQILMSMLSDIKLEIFKEVNSLKEEVQNLKLEISKQIHYQFGFEQIKILVFSILSLILISAIGFILFKSIGGILHNNELLQNISKNILDCYESTTEVKAQSLNLVKGVHNVQESVNSSLSGLAKIETVVNANYQQTFIDQAVKNVSEPIINVRVPNPIPEKVESKSAAELIFGKKFP